MDNKRLRFFSIVCLLAFATTGQAADPVTPGVVGDTLKRPPELVAPQASPMPAAPAAANATPVAPGTPTLTVQSFKFSGNTIFDDATLSGLVAKYLNHPISLAQLYEAADTVGNYYVAKGYLLASAVIPAQNVTGGSVTIEVLEGRVASVSFKGLKRYRSDDLLTYLPEISGQIYRGKTFEEGLRNIDDLPGLEGKAILKPGLAYGTTDIVIEGKEKPVEGEVFFDNSGRKSIGERRTAAQVSLNNPGGIGDVFTVLGLRSTNDHLQYLYGRYGLPLSTEGARLNLSYGYARFNLSDTVDGLKGSNRTAKAEVLVPVLRDARNRLVVSSDVSNTRADTDLSGLSLSETRLTLLEVAGNFSHSWAHQAVTQVSAIVGSNFREADANDRNAQRFRLETDLQHYQPLRYGFQFFGHGIFVYSPDVLPDTQKFAIGGPASVRGYAPSEARGDWGYFGSLTLRHPFQVFSSVVSPRVFVDAGRVRSHDPLGAQPEISLSSAGVGADFDYRHVTGKLDYAVPTDGREVSDGRDDGRFYGSLAVNF